MLRPETHGSAICRRRRSSSWRSRARWRRRAAACSSSTSRPAASGRRRGAALRGDPALKAKGLAIVYISHFLEEVREIADAFTVLRDGKTVGTGAMAGAKISEMIVAKMAGRQVDELFPRVASARRATCSSRSTASRPRQAGAARA